MRAPPLVVGTTADLLQALSRPGGLVDALEPDDKTKVLSELKHVLPILEKTLEDFSKPAPRLPTTVGAARKPCTS